MPKFSDTVNQFYSLIQQFKFIEAVDRFYDEDIISTDNSNEPTKGIENLRKAVEKFVAVAKWKVMNKFPRRLDYKHMFVK